MLTTNLQVLEELGRQAAIANSVLVVVDASQYFGDDVSISTALQELCASGSSIYVPFYKDLQQSHTNGVPVQWSHDGHFNEAGNALLADALYRALIQERPQLSP
jgi:hypothetical protein